MQSIMEQQQDPPMDDDFKTQQPTETTTNAFETTYQPWQNDFSPVDIDFHDSDDALSSIDILPADEMNLFDGVSDSNTLF